MHILSTVHFATPPGYEYDDATWPVLVYFGMTALEPTDVVERGSILDAETMDELKMLLEQVMAKKLSVVTASDLFAGSTSVRLASFANAGAADVVSGRE